MKRDMNDLDFTGLERRLRMTPVGHSPAAPQALNQFIETVPAMSQRRRPRLASRLADSLWLRRGGFAVAAAGAVVIAIVVSSLVVGVRSGQTNGPAASGGWTWQEADGTIVSGPYRVARGYIGTCEKSLSGQGTPCSSPDGLHWTSPADPSIVKIEGGAAVQLDNVVQFGSVYLALARPSQRAVAAATLASPDATAPGTDGSDQVTLWRSADGVSWARVNSPQFAGLSLTTLGSLPNGFILVAADNPQGTGWALTSTDGATWTRSGLLPSAPGISSGGADMFEIGQGPTPKEWTTTDGVNWTALTVPPGFVYVGNVQPLPGGGFMAVGDDGTSNVRTLLRSNDGVNWQEVPSGAAGTLFSILKVGDVLVASAVPGSPAESGFSDLRVWQSQDWGLSWQPLIGPDGSQVSGLAITLGTGVGIEVPDAQSNPRLTWVATWHGSSAATTPQPLHSVPARSLGPTVSVPTSTPTTGLATGGPCDTAVTPSGGPLNAWGTPAWFPAIQPSLGGLSGWRIAGGYYGGDSYGCTFDAAEGIGSEVAVIASCETPQILDVRLLDQTDSQRVVGSFQVTCAIPLSNPQPVFELSGDASTRLGHMLQIYVKSPVPIAGMYAFLIQTTNSQRSIGPTTTR